jgi:carbon storage regulator
VRIGIDAPRGISIQREEVLRAVADANLAAAEARPDDAERIKAALGILPSAGTAPEAPAVAGASEEPAQT